MITLRIPASALRQWFDSESGKSQDRDKGGKYADEGKGSEDSGYVHPGDAGGSNGSSNWADLKEDTGGEAPKIGKPFLVYRLGRHGKLENDNGGNSLGVANHLAMVDDMDAPSPSGGTGDRVMAFRVTPNEEWANYEHFDAEKGVGGNQIGRSATNQVVVYSFPKGGKFSYEKVAEVPLTDIRSRLKELHGTDNFDEAGARYGAEAIRAAFKDHHEATKAKPNADATVPTGKAKPAYGEEPYSQVDMWYDKHTRSWVIQKKDEEGSQVGSSQYVGTKAGAKSVKADWDKGITAPPETDEQGQDVSYLGKQERDWLKEFKAKQRAFEKKTGKKGMRYDAVTTGKRVPPEAVMGYIDTVGDMQVKNMVAMGADKKVKYGGPQDFVRSEGHDFDPPDSPPQIKLMTPKECYSNATKMMLDSGNKYDYVEGYYMSPHVPFPIEHAWLVDKATHTVVDPTLGWQPKARYVGVLFPKKFVIQKMVQNGYYGILSNGVTVSDVVLGIDKDFKYAKK